MVLGVLAAAACQGNGETGGEASEPPSVETGVSVNRIAFVNGIGELFTISPDGDDLRQLTGGIQTGVGSAGPVSAQPLDMPSFYAWPTWSPDGTKIAASRVRGSEGGPQISVEIIDTENARIHTVYNNQVAAEIARGAPHYLYWSPDSPVFSVSRCCSPGANAHRLRYVARGENCSSDGGSAAVFSLGRRQRFLTHP